jgi:hypothetical protein
MIKLSRRGAAWGTVLCVLADLTYMRIGLPMMMSAASTFVNVAGIVIAVLLFMVTVDVVLNFLSEDNNKPSL